MRKALLAMSGLVRPVCVALHQCMQQLRPEDACSSYCAMLPSAFTYFHQAQPISGCAMVLVSLPFRLRVLLSSPFCCVRSCAASNCEVLRTNVSMDGWISCFPCRWTCAVAAADDRMVLSCCRHSSCRDVNAVTKLRLTLVS